MPLGRGSVSASVAKKRRSDDPVGALHPEAGDRLRDVYSISPMIRDQIRIRGTVFAALLGLAFGSFLNVCLSRWPEGESIVRPQSHCRNCGRALKWWENVPLLSWIALRGRCRGCGTWIGWRYVVVEAAVGGLWAVEGWRLSTFFLSGALTSAISDPYLDTWIAVVTAVSQAVLYWLLIALAVLDAEHLWLPNWITVPGASVGLIVSVALSGFESLPGYLHENLVLAFEKELLGMAGAGGLILLDPMGVLARSAARRPGARRCEAHGPAGGVARFCRCAARLGCRRDSRCAIGCDDSLCSAASIATEAMGSAQNASRNISLHRRDRQRSMGARDHRRVSALGGILIAAGIGLCFPKLYGFDAEAVGALASSGSFRSLRASLPCLLSGS